MNSIAPTTTTTTLSRFIPAEEGTSLSNDAPGYYGGNNSLNNGEDEYGPACWSCKGTGSKVKKVKISVNDDENETKKRKRKKGKKATMTVSCTVCSGSGRIKTKKRELESSNDLGEITRCRRCPKEFVDLGCQPARIAALLEKKDLCNTEQTILDLFQKAKRREGEVKVSDELSDQVEWLPRRGEQLCNLVGHWRILQRFAGHRWTTDDLVTAYIAGNFLDNIIYEKKRGRNNNGVGGSDCEKFSRIRHIDLGCGNGSVLQMVAWRYLQHSDHSFQLSSVGVEAREQAVNFARRSISFNLGDVGMTSSKTMTKEELMKRNISVNVVRGDFRQLLNEEERHRLIGKQFADISDSPSDDKRFDLVTGTPPYFRVDFTLATKYNNNESKASTCVAKAVINEGGMPSCLQSAPARCEFRGGIEAYCDVAASIIKDNGLFVVCENWINHERVLRAAKNAALRINSIHPIAGSINKSKPLFAVYTMKKGLSPKEDSFAKDHVTKQYDVIAVRNENGNWTEAYGKVLDKMSISTLS